MNYKLWIAFLLMVCWSCSEEVNLQSEAADFTEKGLQICQDGNCPQIALSYPVFQGADPAAVAINTYIKSYLKGMLSLGEDSTDNQSTLEEAAEGFVRIYQEHKAEYFDMTAEYEAVADVTISYSSEEILVLQMDQYTFTGGAHGNGATSYAFFDPVTGKAQKTEDLIKNSEEFHDLAEQAFRKAFDLAPAQGINEPGFWFEDDQFTLPENMGMTEQSWILIYNPYEIAPYSEGPIEVEIPLKKVAPYLNIH